MERYRLLNAVQTKIDLGGATFDLRSDTVEITATDKGATLVLYRMFDRMNPNPMPDPLCVARIHFPGEARVVKPFELDGVQWVVQTPFGSAIISPYRDDHIVSDPTFETGHGRERYPGRLRKLYEERRSVMFALMANQRFLNATPGELIHAIEAHEMTIGVMQARMAELDQQIATIRATHEIPTDEDNG